ncbi:MAG TPA: ISNCY family transposase [Bacillota bacterium]
MSDKEVIRLYEIRQAVEGLKTVKEVAEALGLSERQVKRLKAGFKKVGPRALAHKNRGRKPKHTVPEGTRKQVIALATTDFAGASHCQMAELLAEYKGISLSHRTVSRILGAVGIKSRYVHRPPRRRRSRRRKPQEGILVQTDASPFDWLEGRGPKMDLHGVIDDATSTVLGLHFRPHEDMHGYLEAFRQMIINHGVPLNVYTDGHTIFQSPSSAKLPVEDQLIGRTEILTQVGRILKDLGINRIPAGSPQAKGRVERLWETLQGRLVIELRLAGICTMEQANLFLPKYIKKYNARFAVAPAVSEAAYRPAPPPRLLDQILTFREERSASNGSTISYNNTTYQLTRKGSVVLLRPKDKVSVLTHLDGRLTALYKDETSP